MLRGSVEVIDGATRRRRQRRGVEGTAGRHLGKTLTAIDHFDTQLLKFDSPTGGSACRDSTIGKGWSVSNMPEHNMNGFFFQA
mmetsp:Transcript_17676/g.35242  ORF Transcript_17676/g.35242 Transcript_17676/m.35242 type:complete len:83 (-) Transcript_17676:88-336(-)